MKTMPKIEPHSAARTRQKSPNILQYQSIIVLVRGNPLLIGAFDAQRLFSTMPAPVGMNRMPRHSGGWKRERCGAAVCASLLTLRSYR